MFNFLANASEIAKSTNMTNKFFTQKLHNEVSKTQNLMEILNGFARKLIICIFFHFNFLPEKFTEAHFNGFVNLESAKNSALFDVSHRFRRKKF